MPLLAGILGSAFAGLIQWLTSFVTRKVAVGTAMAAFLIAGWLALQTALYALWTSIAFSIPAGIVDALSVVSYLLPDNFSACLQALVLAKIGRWLWDRQREWGQALAAA